MRRWAVASLALAVAAAACSREPGKASERAPEQEGELPGAPPFPPEVARKIEAAVARLPSRPRYTRSMRKAPSRPKTQRRSPRRRGPSVLTRLGQAGRRAALLVLLGAVLAYPGAFLIDALIGAILAAVP